MIIDFHSHIIPNIDDGSRSIEESITLLKLAASQGISTVVATPHYRRRGDAEYIERIKENFLLLCGEAKVKVPEITLYLGQELRNHHELSENIAIGKGLTINNSRYVLVEFETTDSYETIYDGLRRLLDYGYIPVIAHVERYYVLNDEKETRRNIKRIEEIKSLGCLIQMNYDSIYHGGLVTLFSPGLCRMILNNGNLIKEGLIDILGTDMHRTDFRPPDIKAPLKWLRQNVSAETFEKLTYKNALGILQNQGA